MQVNPQNLAAGQQPVEFGLPVQLPAGQPRTFTFSDAWASLSNGVHRSNDYIRTHANPQLIEKFKANLEGLAMVGSVATVIMIHDVPEVLIIIPAMWVAVAGCMGAVAGLDALGRDKYSRWQAEKILSKTVDFQVLDSLSPEQKQIATATQLSAQQMQEAKETGEFPRDFRDPIYYVIPREPVTFAEDPGRVIFDKATLSTLKTHPTLNKPLEQLTPIPLPHLELQILEFLRAHPKQIVPF